MSIIQGKDLRKVLGLPPEGKHAMTPKQFEAARARTLEGPIEPQFNKPAIDTALGRKMPTQKPGKSKQDYATPRAFLDAVKLRFGIKRFNWDLAATAENAVDGLGPDRQYYGPDHRAVMNRDALATGWQLRGDLWLNPPFADIAPWAEKCAASAWYESEKGKRGPGPADDRRIFLLVPAAVGSNWFARYVDGKALVLFLNGRIPFDGCPINPKTGKVDGYIKDCMLAIYGMKPGYIVWRWQGAPLR